MTMEMTPEMWTIALDQLGQNIAPNNPFAGIGTNVAKSSLATQRAGELQQRGEAQNQLWMEALSGSLTPKDKPGATSLNLTAGESGMEYTLKGIGESELGTLGDLTPPAVPPAQPASGKPIGAPPAQTTFSPTTGVYDNTMDKYIKSLGGFQIQ